MIVDAKQPAESAKSQTFQDPQPLDVEQTRPLDFEETQPLDSDETVSLDSEKTQSSEAEQMRPPTVDELIDTKRYYALKKLLLAEEYERLEKLEHSINQPKAHAEKIAPSLPEAIKQSNLNSVYLALDLNTVVQDKIIESVQNDTEMYTAALYPVILPAIKKSIAEAFKEMMQSLNYAIEQGLSLNRLTWHVEALRSGVPYREIVLRNTLTYRVEQVFLIHRESGMLMRHVASADVEQLRDSDAVSAMLTAIQDFIKDSFSVNEHDYLDTVEIGNYTVFLTRDNEAVLACVTQGIPPYSLRETFDETLQIVHKNYADELKNFEGDSSVLEPADEILESCLVSEKKDEFEKKDPSIKNFAILLGVILIGVAYWRYDFWQFQKRAESYMASLQKSPGVVIAHYDYDGKHLSIEGLYDPLAKNPQQSIGQFNLKEQDISSSWQAYQSLEPLFLEHRIASLLLPADTVALKVVDNTLVLAGAADPEWIKSINFFKPAQIGVKAISTKNLKTHLQAITDITQPPPTVTLTFEQAHLLVRGVASIDWIQSLPEKLTPLSFVKNYDTSTVVVLEELQFQQLVTKLEDFFIYFANGKATPKDTEIEYIDHIAKMIKELQKLAVKIHKPIDLVVTGHTDGTGSVKLNKTLAEKRAEYMVEQLGLKGINVNVKKAIKIDPNHKVISERERKSSLKVIFTEEEL